MSENNAELDYMNMSDEDFEKAPLPDMPEDINEEDVNSDDGIKDSGSEEEKLEEAPEKVNEPKEEETNVNSGKELTNKKQPTNIQPEASVKEPSNVNYEEFYKQVMAPFKANGKMISLKDAGEAIHLMQQGANYTEKMQRIAPYRKTLLMLEKNGLLDENQLSFLIDVKNKNPEAIKKFLKDNQIDPLDIDTSQEPNYEAGKNLISDPEANFRFALKELADSPNGQETLQIINNTWDDTSKNSLMSDPEILNHIHAQVQNGAYELIVNEMNRRKAVGQLQYNAPFLQSYLAVGNDLLQQYQNQQANTNVHAPVAVRSATRSMLSNGNKIRQARISSKSSPQASNPVPDNFLTMSDEEFLQKFGNRRY